MYLSKELSFISNLVKGFFFIENACYFCNNIIKSILSEQWELETSLTNYHKASGENNIGCTEWLSPGLCSVTVDWERPRWWHRNRGKDNIQIRVFTTLRFWRLRLLNITVCCLLFFFSFFFAFPFPLIFVEFSVLKPFSKLLGISSFRFCELKYSLTTHSPHLKPDCGIC